MLKYSKNNSVLGLKTAVKIIIHTQVEASKCWGDNSDVVCHNAKVPAEVFAFLDFETYLRCLKSNTLIER